MMTLYKIGVLVTIYLGIALQTGVNAGELGDEECERKTYPINGTIEPVTFTTPLTHLRWLGGEHNADKYVFALTGGKGFEAGGEVYRSDDFGSHVSWRNISDDLEGLLDPPAAVANHSYLRFLKGAIDIHHSPRASKSILIQGVGHHNWISEDFGTVWEKVESPGKSLGYWTTIKMHPNKTEWLLALTKRHICWSVEIDASTDANCASDLFVSQDFGKSWTNLTENSQGRIASFVDFDWGAHLNSWWGGNANDAEDSTIFATVYEDPKHMKGPLPGWDHNVHYIRSLDFFKTGHEKLVSCGNTFDFRHHKVYLAVPSNCPYHPDGSKRKLSAQEAVSSSVLLYVSEDKGVTFKEACIPIADLDLGYELRSSFFGNGTMLIANHGQQDLLTGQAPVSNVYSSSGDSGLFSLTIPRVFRQGSHTDFVGVDGLPGMYIANLLGFNAFTEAALRWDKEDTDYEKYLMTMVSYNGGSDWNLLKQPEKFNYPSCDSCSALDERWGCQLHLHGPSSWRATEGKMPALHSHFSAPGVVMAVGNTGEFLDTSSDVSCTFLSRDGGETWQDIADHANVFDFGDHGGILIMARHQTQGPAKYIQFSIDQGRCWHHVNLSEAIDIIDIRVEPTSASQVFLVYGKACERSEWHPSCSHTEEGTRPQGKLYALNFEEILGEDWKVCGDEAYEKWSVPSNERCLLGRNITLTRRKSDAACFNGKHWERPQGIHDFCDCTKEDVECEYGYQWNPWRQECEAIRGMNVDVCPAISSHKWIQSDTHLRLLTDDACHNISTIIHDTDGRGHSTLPNNHAWLKKAGVVVVVTVAVIGIGAVIAQYIRGRNEGQGGSLFAAPAAAIGGAVDWIKSKVTGQKAPESGYSQPLSGDIDDFDIDEEESRTP